MKRMKSAGNALLVVVSVVFCFAVLEASLRIQRPVSGPSAATAINVPPPITTGDAEIPDPPRDLVALEDARHQLLTMPDEWQRRPTIIPGAVRADRWQGALEVYNSEGMRWSGPIPPKQDDTYRVMVVGDSLTYGDGLAEDRRFSNLLGQWLDKDYKIEFINLGHDGYQSEDVLATIKKYLPTIKPNLVFYAVCQNDFLPSAVGQYNPDGYPFPLPPAVKSFLIAHTYAGAFLNELYDSALRRLHLRADFFDDILKNFSDYQTRFGRDVAEMNQLVTSAGLPPIVAMVLDQFPSYGGRGHKITLIAEDLLNKAGAEVIPTENYYRKFNNRAMKISKWEGHPDEVANWIWATMIERKLIGRHQLKFFKRARNATSADRPSSSALTGP